MKNKVGISLLVLVISGCVLLSAAFVVGGFFLLRAQKNYTPPTTVASTTPDIDTQMNEIQLQVEKLRGLKLETSLQRALMTPEELKDTVINDFFKDYTDEDARQDVKVLSTLGLLRPDFDLYKFYIDLYSEQIAGFYDQETKEMYVIAGEAFGGPERMTYAHEFNHVLQDQTYDLENGMKLNDDYCELDTEYCAAVSSLIEGDSTLTETQWFIQYSTSQDKKDLQAFQNDYESPVYDSAPAYMQQDFLFPYQQGYTFVETLFNKGGFKAIDAAYLNPPVTTEQILHPEKYPDGKPVKVEMPDFLSILDSGWTELDNNVMGEWYSYLILTSGISPQFRLDEESSKTATDGWGGDTYLYYASEDMSEYLFTWRSIWDSAKDAEEYYAAIRDYGQARWGIPNAESADSISWTSETDGMITMRKNGSSILWLMSSSESISSDALSLIGEFGN